MFRGIATNGFPWRWMCRPRCDALVLMARGNKHESEVTSSAAWTITGLGARVTVALGEQGRCARVELQMAGHWATMRDLIIRYLLLPRLTVPCSRIGHSIAVCGIQFRRFPRDSFLQEMSADVHLGLEMILNHLCQRRTIRMNHDEALLLLMRTLQP